MKYLTNIDLNKNELQNVRIQNLSSAPSNPVTGQLYYSTVDSTWYGYNSSTWIDLGQIMTGSAIISLLGYTPVKNGSNTPEINSGNEASRPLATGSGALYFATDTKKIWKDTASNVWTQMGGQDTVNWSSITNIPIASVSTLGLIKVGANLSIDVNGVLNSSSNPNKYVIKEQKFVATEGQTVFAITNGNYLQGYGALSVFINGVKQSFSAYTETSTTSFTLKSGVNVGDIVLAEYIYLINVEPYPYHANEHVIGGVDPLYLTHSNITDFDTQVRTSRLDQMAVPTVDVSMNGKKITNVADPVNAQDVVTKNYADASRQGLSTKDPVRVATTTNLVGTYASQTLTASVNGVLTVDGVTVALNDRILLKNQTTASQNGIFYVSQLGTASLPWKLTRTIDANISSEVVCGMCTWIDEGTTNIGSRWVLNTLNPITLDTTSLSFSKDFQASDIVAGNGLTKSGNQLDIVGTANRITANADSIDIASTYVGQTSITTLGTITTGTWNGGAIPVGNGGTGATSASVARTNLGAVGKYATNIGDGTSTTITVTHNLGTTDISVTLTETASPYNAVMTDWQRVDTNSIKLLFSTAPASNAYRIVIMG